MCVPPVSWPSHMQDPGIARKRSDSPGVVPDGAFAAAEEYVHSIDNSDAIGNTKAEMQRVIRCRVSSKYSIRVEL